MSQTTPDAPIILDTTGQAIVAQLQRIAGGGGGGSVEAPEYDASIARYSYNRSYLYGDYCKYEGDTYRLTAKEITVTDPPQAFDSTKWEEITDIFDEISKKPGRIVDRYNNGEAFNDIIGNTASGSNSHAEGSDTTASNYCSHAEGYGNTSSGLYAHSEGNSNTAYGQSSHAEGYNNRATGNYSHSEGSGTQASSPNAHAEGSSTIAYGDSTHAEGSNTRANGPYSHSEGSNTQSNAQNAHAEGSSTIAAADSAHAEGFNTQANAMYSHAEGIYSVASGVGSHTSGTYTEAKGIAETAVGKFNASVDPSIDPNYILFSVGNGSGTGNRSNALEIRLDGTGKLNNKTIIAIDPPTTDGTYTLQCTVSNGVAAYSWV